MESMLRKIRLAHHQSQEKLAKELSISPRILFEYEKGSPPKLDTAYRIAAYYQVDIREIFPPETYEFANGPRVYPTDGQITLESYLNDSVNTSNMSHRFPPHSSLNGQIKRHNKK